MGPITNYELGKAQHRELEAEFEQYGRYQVDQSGGRRSSKIQRLILGAGSLILSVFVIVQMLVR